MALASAEAELYALSTVIMECKGVASFLEELGEYPIIEGHCDATATIAIASRLGLAKLKHIEIRHLWLQDEVREGRLVLHKIPSADNPADILTKILDALDHVRIAGLVGITLVWPLAKGAVSSNGDVQAVGRFLQLITLAACAYQGDATDEGYAHGHLMQDMVVYILCTALPLILALLFLQRVGLVQIVQTAPTIQTTTARMTDEGSQTPTRARHQLELHDVTYEGLKKIGGRLGMGSARAMLKDDMIREIRANPEFEGLTF